jgi:threonine/homoserine/homoserine lactone efflux protein
MSKYLSRPNKKEKKQSRSYYTLIMIICFLVGFFFPLVWLFAIIAGIGVVRSQEEMDGRLKRIAYNILIPLVISLIVYFLLMTYATRSLLYPEIMGPWIVYVSAAVGIVVAIYGFAKSRK